MSRWKKSRMAAKSAGGCGSGDAGDRLCENGSEKTGRENRLNGRRWEDKLMNEKKIEKLYELLERAEKEHDTKPLPPYGGRSSSWRSRRQVWYGKR